MPGFFDEDTKNAKMILMGDQGEGKTGAKAALVAAGYKLRIVDVDRGAKILRSLLTDPHYPYAAYMKKHGIDPTEPGRISVVPIDVPMEEEEVTIRRDGNNMSYEILKPTSARPWKTILNLLRNWKDGDANYGPITEWDSDTVLDIDTLSTAAELAKYWNQGLNNRLGALEDDHGRDTGAAQELASRLAIKLTSPLVKCNVIVTMHRRWVDINRGAPLSPAMLLRDTKAVDAKGYPAIIGNALSPFFGKRWNDQYLVKQDSSGARFIHTKTVDNTATKHSVWLEPKYPVSTGLAEIFAALQFKELPEDFVYSIRVKDDSSGSEAAKPDNKGPSGFGGGGFGSR